METRFERAILRNGYTIYPGRNNLYRAQLTDQDLRCLDLRDSDFRGADLRGVDFAFSDLRGALFDGASLTGARFLLTKGILPKGYYLLDDRAYFTRQADSWKFTRTNKETARESLEHEISKISYDQRINRAREARRLEESLNPISEVNDFDDDY